MVISKDRLLMVVGAGSTGWRLTIHATPTRHQQKAVFFRLLRAKSQRVSKKARAGLCGRLRRRAAAEVDTRDSPPNSSRRAAQIVVTGYRTVLRAPRLFGQRWSF